MGVGLDGIVAKRKDLPYQSGERTGMQKIKEQRTADCVVGGFRYLENKPLVGSLLLGLYNEEGLLDHVGFSSSIQADERLALTRKLEKIIKPPGFTGKAPGGLSRWSTKHSDGVAAAGSETCGRSAVRSFHRRQVPAWHTIPALAAGEASARLHHEAGEARK